MATIPQQLIGESPEFHAMSDWISDIASLNLPVLVLGEAGTGKAMVASRLHFLSPRWEQSNFSINCAAYDEPTVSEFIFGGGNHAPLLEQAEGGTLFIDNIENLSESFLERLAQLVEFNSYRPMDGQDVQTVDIRFVFSADPKVIASSDRRSLLSAYLDRLAADVVNIPPLRDRKADILPLMLQFGRKTASKLGAEKFPGLTSEAIEALLAYDWPGNMRELRHVIERSTARAFLSDETLSAPISNIIFNPFVQAFREPLDNAPKAEPTDTQAPTIEPETTAPKTTDFSKRVFTFERGLIDEAMTIHDHHQGNAAKHLGLTYHAFRGLLRKHGLKK